MPNASLPYQVITQSDYPRMPWKNGLGSTLEIQKLEDNQGLRFRISQAAVVEDGVFSDFSGLHRTLVLLSGDGMTLAHLGKHDNHTSVLSHSLDIARFLGADETHATLKNGKIEDLNIMVRDTDTQAKVEACTAPCSLIISDNDTLFSGFYASEDSVIEIKNTNTLAIKAHNMILFSSNKEAQLSQGSGIFIQVLTSN